MDFLVTVNSSRNTADGKLVIATVSSKGVLPDQMARRRMEAQVRAKALAYAGFAKDGFLRNLNLQLETPRLERRTEIIGRDEVGDKVYRYEVEVKDGPLLG